MSAQGVNIGGIPPALIGARTYVPTYYYTGTALISSDGSTALTLNIEYAFRFEVFKATTFDRIGLEVTAAGATAVVRLGIRNDTGAGLPGTLILDAGAIDASTTGFKEFTIAQILQPGRYWLSGTPQVAASSSRIRTSPDAFVGQATSASDNSNCYIQAAAGALPAGFPATPGTAGTCPKVLVRAA